MTKINKLKGNYLCKIFYDGFKKILTASMVLFAVIDIVGSIPIVISLREKAGHIQSEKASLVAAVIMIAFLFWEKKY